MKPGGTEGGSASFLAGLGLVIVAVGLYMLMDSVHVSSGGMGVISGWMSAGRSGYWTTTSMGIIFVPFLIGVVLLFYNANLKLGWFFLWSGLGIIVIEILSRIRFEFSMKTSHLILILALTAAGVGLVFRGLREEKSETRGDEQAKP